MKNISIEDNFSIESLQIFLLAFSLSTISFVWRDQITHTILLILFLNIYVFFKNGLYRTLLPFAIITIPFIVLSSPSEIGLVSAIHQLRICMLVSVAYWLVSVQDRLLKFVNFNNTVNCLIIVIGLFEHFFNLAGIALDYTIEPGGWRFQGLTTNPNYYTQWLFSSLMFNLILEKTGGFKSSKRVIFLYIFGLILAGSRGMLVSVLLVLCLVKHRMPYSISGIKSFSMATIISVLLSIITSDADNIRIDVWMSYLQDLMNSASLFFGEGGGTISNIYGNFEYYPHNSYIMILYEFGIFGVFLFLLLLSILIYHVRRMPFGQVMVLVLAIYAIFNDLHMTPHFWFSLGIILSLRNFVNNPSVAKIKKHSLVAS